MDKIGIDPIEFEKFNRMSEEERKKWVEEETEKRLEFFHTIRTQNKAVFTASGESE